MQMRGFTTTKDSTDTHRQSTEKPKLSVKPLNEALRILRDFTRRDIFQLKARKIVIFSRP